MRRSMKRALVGPFLFALSAAMAAAPPPVTLREVATGFSNPTEIVNARDGSRRLFVLEQGGLIKVIRDGAVLATPFLDLSAEVSTTGERGLLGLAFHPRYGANHRFFVYYASG